VKANPGAIGYVSGAADLAGVKVLRVTGYRVIVNAANPMDSMSKVQLGRLFLKKSAAWDDGTPAVPVDQVRTADVRALFTDEVLKKRVNNVISHWQQMAFSGRGVPPSELNSDADVLAFVKANRGAIGYVSRGEPLADVKIVRVGE
jgi:ABC-type phosphate transport system substrate-binding protein